MLKSAAALSVLLIAIPKLALCDWQYTRWGMTPDQVKTAAMGRASDNSTDMARSTASSEALLKGTYSARALDFQVYFWFARKTHKLERVTLELIDPTKGAELYNQLVGTYGPPQSQDRTGQARTARWTDRKNRNQIAWLTFGFTSTTLQYSELPAGPGRGI